MSNESIATGRRTVNVAVVTVIAWVAARLLNVEIASDDPIVLLAAPMIVGIGARLSYWLAARFPAAGWVLFGYGTQPTYPAKVIR